MDFDFDIVWKWIIYIGIGLLILAIFETVINFIVRRMTRQKKVKKIKREKIKEKSQHRQSS